LEAELDAQSKENEKDVARKFQDAIKRSQESGSGIQDHDAILSKLLDARKNYTKRLSRSIENGRNELKKLLAGLERDSRRYEEDETRVRQNRVREALELLGPRDLNPPLLSILDRRGLAINYWTALSRIKHPVKYPFMWDPAEGPWHHEAGAWERVGGEHTCGRCSEKAFHFIAECGPTRCSGCGLVVCNECFRDLRLLQEYGEWIVSSEGDMKDSLFCLDFDSTAE
jgi:hypothetical protein